MKLSIANLVSTAVSVLAVAIPETRASAMVERDVPILGPPGLTAWSDTKFQGKEVHYGPPQVAWNACHVLTNDFPVGQPAGVSSIASDPHNFCILYPNEVCDPGANVNDNDRLWMIGSYDNLADPEVGWDNRPGSFICNPLGY